MSSQNRDKLTTFFWKTLKGHKDFLPKLLYVGPEHVLPSVFDVTSFAASTIGVATLAALEFKELRLKEKSELKASVDSFHASIAFKGDFKPLGWEIPPVWDPFAGDYETKNGWIRLHTNYTYHRDAVFQVLGVCNTKEELAEKVRALDGEKLEAAVVAAGGCAAVMYEREVWGSHPHGKIAGNEPMLHFSLHKKGEIFLEKIEKDEAPLKEVRVLDMTRVIAGPTCTKFLSAHGASVLRIDPPNFEEVPALIPETSVGKKRAFLDLTTPEGKKHFEVLIKQAHVFVHGLRPDALEKLGFNEQKIYQLNPNIILATLDAYGFQGPWKNRRGFDSLVQMSSGIAHAGAMAKKTNRPTPLPVQSLDFGVGYLLAAAVIRALTELQERQTLHNIKASLVGASNTLSAFTGNLTIASPASESYAHLMIKENSHWGELLRVKCPGTINDKYAEWKIPAGPLGSDPAIF